MTVTTELLAGRPLILAVDRPSFNRNSQAIETMHVFVSTPWGDRVQLSFGRIAIEGAPDIATYVIDAPTLYDRPGNPYEDPSRQPYGDNHRRFALLGWAAAQIAHLGDRHAAIMGDNDRTRVGEKPVKAFNRLGFFGFIHCHSCSMETELRSSASPW